MTPSERERRIEAAAQTIFGFASPTRWDTVATGVRVEYRKRAAEVLDAADEVVPMVSQRVKDEQQEVLDRQFWNMRTALTERAERAEAAARDFARALHVIVYDDPADYDEGPYWYAIKALARHPSFSGEEGTGE